MSLRSKLHTAMSCRIGIPVENLAHGYRESVCSPIFSTAIGLLQRGLADVAYEEAKAEVKSNTPETVDNDSYTDRPKNPSNVSEEKSPTWLENVFRKTKEWFEAEPDLDFRK